MPFFCRLFFFDWLSWVLVHIWSDLDLRTTLALCVQIEVAMYMRSTMAIHTALIDIVSRHSYSIAGIMHSKISDANVPVIFAGKSPILVFSPIPQCQISRQNRR